MYVLIYINLYQYLVSKGIKIKIKPINFEKYNSCCCYLTICTGVKNLCFLRICLAPSNGNKYAPLPIGQTTQMKEEYDSI